ncbi:Hypothetical predicted protein [Cloeon dipterum]|uniref:Uncharacterized protein n=1 Tax=Cloeon dipterum TaxID=197152 RepID=A0A8S1CMX0_9INSE|nr:Hypothetical predicted protein [Cloeon dipterum]
MAAFQQIITVTLGDGLAVGRTGGFAARAVFAEKGLDVPRFSMLTHPLDKPRDAGFFSFCYTLKSIASLASSTPVSLIEDPSIYFPSSIHI